MEHSSNVTSTYLRWTAPTQTNVAYYKLFRITANSTALLVDSACIAEIPWSGNPSYHDVFPTIGDSGNYWYALKSISWADGSSAFSNVMSATRTSGVSMGGPLTLSGAITVTSLNVTGNASVQGTLEVCGDTTFHGNISACGVGKGGLTVHSFLTCGAMTSKGQATFQSARVCSSLSVHGGLLACAALSVRNQLICYSAITAHDTMHVCGAATFGDAVTISGTLTVNAASVKVGTAGSSVDIEGSSTKLGTGTAYMTTGDSGQVTFTGAGCGLTHANMSVTDNTVVTTITASGVAVQFIEFSSAGSEINMSASVANDYITVVTTGAYFVACNLVAESVGGGAQTFHFDIMRNTGSSALTGIHAHRYLSGGGLDKGSIGMSGIAILSAGTTVELWCTNDTNASDMVVSDCSLSAIIIGGQ